MLSKKKKLDITVSADVFNILDINDIEGTFRAKFRIGLKWSDDRLMLKNLNKDPKRLSKDDHGKIWSPELVLHDSEVLFRYSHVPDQGRELMGFSQHIKRCVKDFPTLVGNLQQFLSV